MSSNGASPDRQLALTPFETLDAAERPAALGALLFLSEEPVPLTRLAKALQTGVEEVRSALAQLEDDVAAVGLSLHWSGDDAVHLATAATFSAITRQFLGLERPVRLSQAALETAAIVAYCQPVTRADVDALRGVDSGGVIQTLIARELIEQVGRSPGIGHPIQYGTTPEFLRFFGIRDLSALPEAPEEVLAFIDGNREVVGPKDESEAR